MKFDLKLILQLFILVFCISCDDMHDVPVPVNLPETPNETGHMYILSEGLFNMNNSTLCRIDFEKRSIETDFFALVNGRGLGDTANDMKFYGNKLWIVVNVSSQIEVLDITTGISVRRIPIFNPNGIARQARFITFLGNKAYVCSFDGTVTRIDIPSMAVDGVVTCGRNPDGITVANGKLYVSNSGGLDQPNYDKTISVIDPAIFTETKKITVGQNPFRLESDSEGDLYVVTRGNNADIKPVLYRIDTRTDEVVQSFGNIPAVNFTLHNDTAYLYNYDYIRDSYWIKTFDCRTEQIISENFVADGTVLEHPFSLYLNPVNGNVYLTDARNYTVKGDLLCFSRHGKLLYKLESIGLNPNTVLLTD